MSYREEQNPTCYNISCHTSAHNTTVVGRYLHKDVISGSLFDLWLGNATCSVSWQWFGWRRGRRPVQHSSRAEYVVKFCGLQDVDNRDK